MVKPFFTIIIVSYNAGDDLLESVGSILKQNYKSFRIIIKDGGSTDGSIERTEKLLGIKANEYKETDKYVIIKGEDNGIYDAMNIATTFLKKDKSETGEGSFVYFLGCGDILSNEAVLTRVHDGIIRRRRRLEKDETCIFYGDIKEALTGQLVSSNPKIDDFACYRNVPSHQACFYDERLIWEKTFDTNYVVRADYDHFLKCFYQNDAVTVYTRLTVAQYKGGGFSETQENRLVSEKERKEIIAKYLPKAQIAKYDLIRMATLAPIRTRLAEDPKTAGVYNAIKKKIYQMKNGK
ncbi:MAG: glycosyltransferase [Butyrivibrio sp.]|nr:glycosyltransferase [Butyrivibrio sp.]